ncbi:uncharacterized protein F5147DRAFT_813420 [Suillus discolor]|uniref:Uncharacterized protein n=1 Tax=Suillus discolor TaxID=1912936 RepID=A0A9P7F1T8_9AGAM|nr:uncharacterized protein F5147DRAFT_813420 [Suillus discolor]KAG2100204.1 hypothetical protein F5147DRAFT_813420 [Suillus discolor]
MTAEGPCITQLEFIFSKYTSVVAGVAVIAVIAVMMRKITAIASSFSIPKHVDLDVINNSTSDIIITGTVRISSFWPEKTLSIVHKAGCSCIVGSQLINCQEELTSLSLSICKRRPLFSGDGNKDARISGMSTLCCCAVGQHNYICNSHGTAKHHNEEPVYVKDMSDGSDWSHLAALYPVLRYGLTGTNL